MSHEHESETIIKIKMGAIIGMVVALVLFILGAITSHAMRITVIETNYPHINEKLNMMDKKLDALMGVNPDNIVVKKHNKE